MNGIETKSAYWTDLKACLSIFRIKVLEGFQYRTAGLAGATTGIFWSLIEITVYTIFYSYASNREAGMLAGLTLRQVISYVWLGQVFFLMQQTSIDPEILGRINSGDVAVEMCRPVDLYLYWFSKIAAARLTFMLWRGTGILAAGILMPPSYRLSLPASFGGFLAMLFSAFSAFLLCSAFGMLVVAVRLNIAWGEGPTYIIMLAGLILSGNYLPLQLWPKFLQGFLLVQPFAGYLDIPLRLYLGTMQPQDGVFAVGLQLAWTAAFVAAGRLLLSFRLKNIIVQGG